MADQDTQTTDKSFEDAFAELTRVDSSPETSPPPAETPAPAAEAATPEAPVAEAAETPETPPETPETPADGEGDDNDADGEDESDAGEDERAPQSVARDAAREDEDLINRLGALLAKTQAPQQTAPQPQPEAAQAQEEPITLEDLKLIEEVEKDWPDVVRAVRAERNFIVHKTVDYVFKEVAKELRPLAQLVNSLAQRTHLQELESRVPDYGTVTDKVISWVDKQPAYLQAAYKHVIQQGTADEVADLIGRFKADTGAATPPPASPSKKKAELPTASKQAVAALAPVSTKRSATASGGIDPSDFDGAFAAFASKVN